VRKTWNIRSHAQEHSATQCVTTGANTQEESMADDVKTLIDRFLQDQDDTYKKWRLFAINPFSSAYEDALGRYNTTLEAQRKVDEAEVKQQVELMMLALSLTGGGLLNVAFGSAAMNSVINQAAVPIICRYNMERAFRAAHFVATNKTAEFIGGQLYTEVVEKRTSDAITEKLTKMLSQDAGNFPSVAGLSPERAGTVKMQNMLDAFILEAHVKAADFAKGIRDSPKLTDDEKRAHLAKLRQSNYLKPPTRSVDDGHLAIDIELAFYLEHVLGSDYLRTFESRTVTYYEGRNRHSKVTATVKAPKITAIQALPSSGSYPGQTRNQEIGFSQLGSEIAKRLNQLHKAKYGRPFLEGKTQLSDLRAAERTITQLADRNIKRLIQGVVPPPPTGLPAPSKNLKSHGSFPVPIK
jgi:hypothetical protein